MGLYLITNTKCIAGLFLVTRKGVSTGTLVVLVLGIVLIVFVLGWLAKQTVWGEYIDDVVGFTETETPGVSVGEGPPAVSPGKTETQIVEYIVRVIIGCWADNDTKICGPPLVIPRGVSVTKSEIEREYNAGAPPKGRLKLREGTLKQGTYYICVDHNYFGRNWVYITRDKTFCDGLW